MTAVSTAPTPARFQLGRRFTLENGSALPDLEIAYRTWGTLSAAADNAVVVCHALTGSPDVDRWWAALIGPGRALDPARDFIIASNALGGCYGTTGPRSRDASGARLRSRFPKVTVRDQVDVQIALANHLGVRGITLVIGGSMGGLQAIEWPLLDDRVRAVATIAASARHSAWCMGWSEAQRLALSADPAWRDGDYADDAPPRAGLAAARAVAMLTYRTAASLGRRFGRLSGADVFDERAAHPTESAVSNWLRHHGAALDARFDARSYWTLLAAMDSHDVGRGRGGVKAALARVTQRTLVVSIPSDALYVSAEQREMARLLPNAEYVELDSEHGHDGFLIDAARLEPVVRAFRNDAVVARAA